MAFLDGEVAAPQAPSLFCTIPYGTRAFSWLVVTNRRGEASLHGGIFPQRLSMLEFLETVAQVCTLVPRCCDSY